MQLRTIGLLRTAALFGAFHFNALAGDSGTIDPDPPAGSGAFHIFQPREFSLFRTFELRNFFVVGGAPTPPAPDSAYKNAKVIFCWPFWSDATQVITDPFWYGTGFRVSVPASRLSDERLYRVSRTIDLDPANTQVRCNLGAVRSVAAIGYLTNATPSATMRHTLGFSDAQLDSGSPIVVTDWQNCWTAGFTQERAQGINLTALTLLAQKYNAQYIKTEFLDAGNPSGYLEISRGFVADTVIPRQAMSIGAKQGFNDPTISTASDGSATQFDEKKIARTWTFELDRVTEAQMYESFVPMLRLLGKARQLFVVFDRNDPYMPERAILCRLAELGEAEYPYGVTENKIGYRLTEVL